MLGIPQVLFIKGNFLHGRSRQQPAEIEYHMDSRTRSTPRSSRQQSTQLRPSRPTQMKTSPRRTGKSSNTSPSTVLQAPDTLLLKTRHRRTENSTARPRQQPVQSTNNKRQWRNTRVEIATSLPPDFCEMPPSYFDVVQSRDVPQSRVSRSIVLQPRNDELFLEPPTGQTPRRRHHRTIRIYTADDLSCGTSTNAARSAHQRQASVASSSRSLTEAAPIDSANMFGWGAWPGSE